MPGQTHINILLLIAVLAFIAYAPVLSQPFISDDYPNIALARDYGPFAGWEKMAGDEVNRVRATSFVVMYWIDRLFGFVPLPFYAFSILVHIFNCWLIYALGRSEKIGYQVSGWGAAFFAIYEGHQEAVMWFSACNELLLFFFGILALLGLMMFFEQGRFRWLWYIGSLGSFGLALLTKESSVILIPLFMFPLLDSNLRLQKILYLLPFGILGVVYTLSVFQTRSHSFRFYDGSFDLSAPFWITWSKSFIALLWFWGFLAVGFLLVSRKSGWLLLTAFVWASISFIPYMFLTYMYRIPSRQTYLASAALALAVGAAIAALRERFTVRQAWIPSAVLCIMLAHNVGYLWIRKRSQFLERAEPTEQLIDFARGTSGPIFVRCFPLAPLTGNTAVKLALGKHSDALIWDEAEAVKLQVSYTFCYDPQIIR